MEACREYTHHMFSTKCCDLIFDYWKNPFNWNTGFIWWCLCWREQFEDEHNVKMVNKEQLIYVIKIKMDYSNQPISHEEGWWTDQGWLITQRKIAFKLGIPRNVCIVLPMFFNTVRFLQDYLLHADYRDGHFGSLLFC